MHKFEMKRNQRVAPIHPPHGRDHSSWYHTIHTIHVLYAGGSVIFIYPDAGSSEGKGKIRRQAGPPAARQ
jgi:hypothetical protein